jgi:type IV pilus assembly protein PilX
MKPESHGEFPMQPVFPRRQKGIVLLVSLIVLVAMTLAGVALMRSVDTAVVVAGNLAFKESAVQVAESGVQVAKQYLSSRTVGALINDDPGNGYYSALPLPEPDWFDSATWAGSAYVLNSGTPDAAGNVTQIIIHRMCDVPGIPWDDVNNHCARQITVSSSAGESRRAGSRPFPGPPLIYYRVTARVDGPRNTVSITQTSFSAASGGS